MIPRNVIDNLRCSFCNNRLSVFPIYTYGDKNTISCGRCPKQDEFLPQREILYEELAQHIEFSCQYENNGCIEKLKPADLQTHEPCCIHKPCFCPIVPLGNCKFGDHNDLFKHFQDSHSDLIYEDLLIEMDITKTHEEDCVFRQNNKTFVVKLLCDLNDGKFFCSVKCCEHAITEKGISYCVSFVSKRKKYTCEPQTVHHIEVGNIRDEDTATIVNITDITTNLNHPSSILLKIDINESLIEENKAMNTEENKILMMLECPICFEYMVPPIVQCTAGHSFCQSCRNRFTICPLCKGSIDETRNYLLEKLTSVIEYPCKYNKFGCRFSGNERIIKDHESNCKNAPCKCIIDDCTWVNEHSELINHLNENHKDNVLETNYVVCRIYYHLDKESYEYVMVSYGNVFKIDFTRDRDQFSWDFRRVDTNENFEKYMYELNFDSTNGEQLNVKKIDALHLVFHMDQLINFITNDMLVYKIRISKVI